MKIHVETIWEKWLLFEFVWLYPYSCVLVPTVCTCSTWVYVPVFTVINWKRKID